MMFRTLTKGLLFLLLAALIPTAAIAQEPDYNQEQYDAYTKAVNEADPAAREDAILAFIKENPDLSLVPYAIGAYIKTMQEYQQKGENDKVISAGEKLLAYDPKNANALSMTTVAAFQKQDYARAATHGEKAYAQNPTPGLTYILAISYQSLDKQEEFLKYGEKACSELEVKDCLQIASSLKAIYSSRENWEKASEYSNKSLEALKAVQKPETTSDAEWKTYIERETALSYAILGQAAVKQNNWKTAITSYQKALQHAADKNLKAEAYYYIGRGNWEQDNVTGAMEAFARGSVLKGSPNAEICRQQLEKLYRATHNDSTAGLEEFVAGVTGTGA